MSAIAQSGWLLSDARVRDLRAAPPVTIGFVRIKDRRLRAPVPCHPGTTVGQYVPFFFCPRSVMLFQIHAGHDDLPYQYGQRRVCHLVLSIPTVLGWAEQNHVRWAVAAGNAAVAITPFATGNGAFNALDETAINARYWADPPEIKQRKMAEFLILDRVPWDLVAAIGVMDNGIRDEVMASLTGVEHVPDVVVHRDWYYPERHQETT